MQGLQPGHVWRELGRQLEVAAVHHLIVPELAGRLGVHDGGEAGERMREVIEGVPRHDTEMDVERQYVDTHGQSEVGLPSAVSWGLHCYRA